MTVITKQVDWFQVNSSIPLGGLVESATWALDETNNKIVAFGLAGTWLFDGSVWRRATPPHSPPLRDDGAMAFMPGIGVVLYGGHYDSGYNPGVVPPKQGDFADTWVWDGTDWYRLTLSGASPGSRSGSRMAYYPPQNGLIMFGGDSFLTAGTGTQTWLFTLSPPTWTQLFPAHNPSSRQGVILTLDSAGLLRVVGGVVLGGLGTILTDTWTWNGTDWTSLGNISVSGTTAPAPGYTAGAFHKNLGKALWVNFNGIPGRDTYIEAPIAGGWAPLNTNTDPRLILPNNQLLGGASTLLSADMTGNITAVGGDVTFGTYQLRIVPGVHVDTRHSTQGYPGNG